VVAGQVPGRVSWGWLPGSSLPAALAGPAAHPDDGRDEDEGEPREAGPGGPGVHGRPYVSTAVVSTGLAVGIFVSKPISYVAHVEASQG